MLTASTVRADRRLAIFKIGRRGIVAVILLLLTSLSACQSGSQRVGAMPYEDGIGRLCDDLLVQIGSKQWAALTTIGVGQKESWPNREKISGHCLPVKRHRLSRRSPRCREPTCPIPQNSKTKYT